MTDFNVKEYCNATANRIESVLAEKLFDFNEVAIPNHHIVKYIKSKFSDSKFGDEQIFGDITADVRSLYQKAHKRVAYEWQLFDWLYRSVIAKDPTGIFEEDLEREILTCLEENGNLKVQLESFIEKDSTYGKPNDQVRFDLANKVVDESVMATLVEAFQNCPTHTRVAVRKKLLNIVHPDRQGLEKGCMQNHWPCQYAIYLANPSRLTQIVDKAYSLSEKGDSILTVLSNFRGGSDGDKELLRKFKPYLASFMYLTVFPPTSHHISITIPVYIIEFLGSLSIAAPAFIFCYASQKFFSYLREVYHWVQNIVTSGKYVKKEAQYVAKVLETNDDALYLWLNELVGSDNNDDVDVLESLILLYLNRIGITREESSESDNSVEEVLLESSRRKAHILRALLIVSIWKHYKKNSLNLNLEIDGKTDINALDNNIKDKLQKAVSQLQQLNIPSDIIPEESDDIAKLLERAKECQKQGIETPVAGLYKSYIPLTPFACFATMHKAYVETIKDDLPEGIGAKVGSVLHRTLLALLYVPSVLIDTAISLINILLQSIIIISAAVSIELMMLACNLPVYLYDGTITISKRIYNRFSGRESINEDIKSHSNTNALLILNSIYKKDDSSAQSNNNTSVAESSQLNQTTLSIAEID